MPYAPKFTVTPHLLAIIEEIASFRERIQAAAIQVPWVTALQRDSRSRTAHASTAIEGNPLTLEEVRAIEEGRSIGDPKERTRREVLNQLAGLRLIEKNTGKKRITAADLLALHRVIAAGVMEQGAAGRYRDVQVRVGTFLPPPPEKVPVLMNDLLAWWNREASAWSPVVSSAVVHQRFEEIHPFADGNGRTGRTLALWELYRRGFDTHHVFTVDEIYWEMRPRYYRALAAVRQEKGDLTGWLEFSAEALHLALERVWMRIQRLSVEARGMKIVLRPRQERLLQLLRDHRELAPWEIRELLGVSRQGAMNLLNPLLEAGMVERVGTRRSGKYVLKGGRVIVSD